MRNNDLNNSMLKSFDSAKLASKLRHAPDYWFGDKFGAACVISPADIELNGQTDLRDQRGNRFAQLNELVGQDDSLRDNSMDEA
jgi:hypothetical protein